MLNLSKCLAWISHLQRRTVLPDKLPVSQGMSSLAYIFSMCHQIFTELLLFLDTFALQGFPCGSAGKESACNVGDLGSIPGFGRSPGEGKGYPLQYSGLENSMDCIVHGVAKSLTRLSDFHFHFALQELKDKMQ